MEGSCSVAKALVVLSDVGCDFGGVLPFGRVERTPDRVVSAEYPDWLEGFPASMEEAAEFFADPENVAKFS